jgi:hypothetical protein
MLRSMAFASKRMGASPPARVYVAGGGALIGGLVDALQQLSGIETVVLNPLSGIAHRCDPGTVAAGPVFCVAIGQALLARRKRPPNLMPAELRARRTRVPRLVLAFASLSVALVYVVLAAMALDSAAGIYRKAAEDHGLLRSALASGTGERAELGSLADQDAALAYSLLVGPQPRWSEIVKGVSNAIPRGVLLDNLVFSKESGEGGTVNWRVDIRGAIVDPERAHEILGQMKAGLEEPGPLKSVQMMPLGSTTIDLNGRRIDGAIVFETTGLLE